METPEYNKKIEDLTVRIDKTRQKMEFVLITILNETQSL
jgi:hypothetical protein